MGRIFSFRKCSSCYHPFLSEKKDRKFHSQSTLYHWIVSCFHPHDYNDCFPSNMRANTGSIWNGNQWAHRHNIEILSSLPKKIQVPTNLEKLLVHCTVPMVLPLRALLQHTYHSLCIRNRVCNLAILDPRLKTKTASIAEW